MKDDQDKIDISHVWDKPKLPQFTSMGQKIAQPVNLGNSIQLRLGNTPQNAVEHPDNYLVCEGCADIKRKPDPATLHALMCAACHGYRFTADHQTIQLAARKLMEDRE
jgi:hypothetical protein